MYVGDLSVLLNLSNTGINKCIDDLCIMSTGSAGL